MEMGRAKLGDYWFLSYALLYCLIVATYMHYFNKKKILKVFMMLLK